MILLLIILILCIVFLLFKLISIKGDIRYITNQVKLSKGEFINIKVKSLDKDIERLADEIDVLYTENHKNRIKMKKSEERLKRSISNMSHDLRTPLTSVRGYLQLIESGKCSEEEMKKYLSIIDRRTDSLNTLINCFYDLSRIQNGEYKLKLEYISIGDILCEIVAEFYDEFVKKNIEPHVMIEENIPQVIGDKNAVRRIFANLINNMLKHGEKNVDISMKKLTDCVQIQFSNDAPYLSDEDMEKLFDRFYTGNASRSDKSTGLGLYITKELSEKMNYKINADLKDKKLTFEIIINTKNIFK